MENYPESRSLQPVMKPLSIIVFLDGRPGHEKQTLGVLQALATVTPVEVINRILIKPSTIQTAKNWLQYLLTSLLPFAAQKGELPADIIMGTGTHTHLPMLLLKRTCRRRGVEGPRAVTFMSTDALLQNNFDLCCVPQHDEPVKQDNIFITKGPPNTVIFSNNHDPQKGLILLGGVDRKSHEWDSRSVIKKISNIIQQDPQMTWTISSSPRTPDDACQLLDDLSKEAAKVSFFRSMQTPRGWVEEQYARNSIVWVTADSMSMIYEALTAGCSVGILPVQWKQRQNKFQKSIDGLVNKEMVTEYDKWQAAKSMDKLNQEPLNEALRCAEEILRRWWPDRLP